MTEVPARVDEALYLRLAHFSVLEDSSDTLPVERREPQQEPQVQLARESVREEEGGVVHEGSPWLQFLFAKLRSLGLLIVGASTLRTTSGEEVQNCCADSLRRLRGGPSRGVLASEPEPAYVRAEGVDRYERLIACVGAM